ncbi:MAG: hypothetical protein QM840_03270, partial [Verrucomicrobiota bacterium]|nr:hypothetical protein [Verrucomicrobiota bacterium]
DEIGLAGQQLDDSVFAQAQFAQAVLQFGRTAQLFDAHRDAGLNLAQRTNLAAALLLAPELGLALPFHFFVRNLG